MTTQIQQESTVEIRRQRALTALQDWADAQSNVAQDTDGRIIGAGHTHYEYDAYGNLSVIRDHDTDTRFLYDKQHRLIQVNTSDGSLTQYTYNDDDRLEAIHRPHNSEHYHYDTYGRVKQIQYGDAGSAVYHYDVGGRVYEARTSSITTRYQYDAQHITQLEQHIDGHRLIISLNYDNDGRLMHMQLPGIEQSIQYTWTDDGFPQQVCMGGQEIANFVYQREARQTAIYFANGINEITQADELDGRPLWRSVTDAHGVLVYDRDYQYNKLRQKISDGTLQYQYDAAGQLTHVYDDEGIQEHFTYDERGNRIASNADRYSYNNFGRLDYITNDGQRTDFSYNKQGHLHQVQKPSGTCTYRYDDRGNLLQLRENGAIVARLRYDHKGRLVAKEGSKQQEYYVYGPADELLAIIDGDGNTHTVYIRTPLGILAVWHRGRVYVPVQDDRGTWHALTDVYGEVIAEYDLSPFGMPRYDIPDAPLPPHHNGRAYHADMKLYAFGARWYDPALGRFLTADSYTGDPSDPRIVSPFTNGTQQVFNRAKYLSDWLQRPIYRNRLIYCANDPINRNDPDGHWSFGGVLLMLLGAIWTLPNTVFGLLIEITCLIGEGVRLLLNWISGGDVNWESIGFDAAASGHLNAFALVFEGGWLGSFPTLLGITFGNVFFVYKKWRDDPHFTGTELVHPPAYDGEVGIPRNETLYEHELRHTNQYGWFGPFFHLGLPIFGVYEWDVIFNGYEDAWTERDARDHSENEGEDHHSAPSTGTSPSGGSGTSGTSPSSTPAPTPPPSPSPTPVLYGDYDLKRADNDVDHKYEGTAQTTNLPPAGSTGYVELLQQDLRELGFLIVGTPNGVFGRATEWAVREFQIYAGMSHIAQETPIPTPPPSPLPAYIDRLSQVANDAIYSGAISGVVNTDTRAAIHHWKTNNWRCPVVVSARNSGDMSIFNNHENIWLHDEVNSTTPRMYVRDFTQYYTLPAGRNADDLRVIGDFASYLTWSGPRSVPPNHTWGEAELLPEVLVGTDLASLTAIQRSTYKVVRAVSEVECIGFADSVNSYDNAFISVGPCHWTLGIASNTGVVAEGELCGYLAYLEHADAAAFQAAFKRFGMTIDEDWGTDGTDLFISGSRKYAGWVALQAEGTDTFNRLALDENEGNYFKSWHWFYRFVMAGRSIEGYRRRMWHMARIRLRDILSTPFNAGAGVPNVPDGTGGTRTATIGDVYTSERAIAMLLRWHIRAPAHIVSGGDSGGLLENAFGRANINSGDPSTWGDAEESDLIQGILDEVAGRNFEDSIQNVHDFPIWAGGSNPRGFTLSNTIGSLNNTRDSFDFDDSDLPPTPY